MAELRVGEAGELSLRLRNQRHAVKPETGSCVRGRQVEGLKPEPASRCCSPGVIMMDSEAAQTKVTIPATLALPCHTGSASDPQPDSAREAVPLLY